MKKDLADFPTELPSRTVNMRLLGLKFALCVLTLGTFWQCLHFDFVNWDDPWYVQNNPLIQSWSWNNLQGIATESVARNYAPLTIFSFLIDHTFWGMNPLGFHLTNVLLHTLNVILVFCLLKQLGLRTEIAWLTAAFFGVHPIQAETVAWISSRKGLLSATFMLLSLRYWLRSEREVRHELLGTLFLMAALLSKALAVVLPAIVLLYDMLVRRRSFAEALPRQFIPGLCALWLLSVTMGAQVTIVGGTRDHLMLSKWHILGLDAVIVWRYVGMLLFPRNLCVLYDPPTTGIGLAIASAIGAWLVAFGVAWRYRNRFPMTTWAFCVWWLLLLPVLNLFPITTLMNDRYLYLPCLPLFAMGLVSCQSLAHWLRETHVVRRLREQSRRFRRGGQGCVRMAGIALVMLAAGKTCVDLPRWKDGWALWQHARERAPQMTVVQIQWALTLRDRGEVAAARDVLRTLLAKENLAEIDRERIQQKLHDWSTAATAGAQQLTKQRNGKVVPASPDLREPTHSAEPSAT